MDQVHPSGPWTPSREGVHGPLVHVLSLPVYDLELQWLLIIYSFTNRLFNLMVCFLNQIQLTLEEGSILRPLLFQ